MKRIIKIMLVTVLGCLFFSTAALADDEFDWEQNKKNIFITRESVLLQEGVNQSIGYGNAAKGNFLANSQLNITNEGYGSIGIIAGTYCHVPVRKIRMAVYLDRWDETKEDWFQVGYYNFIYEHKEGDEDLTAVTESFSVIGLPTGCYYRLRSFNCVWPFSGGSEMQGPMTDGILITDGPAY